MYALVMYFNVDHLFYYYLFIPLICILLYIYIYIYFFFFSYGPLSEIKDYYYYYYYFCATNSLVNSIFDVKGRTDLCRPRCHTC